MTYRYYAVHLDAMGKQVKAFGPYPGPAEASDEATQRGETNPELVWLNYLLTK